MKETEIEKLRQLVSRTDMSGNEKVNWLVQFINDFASQSKPQEIDNVKPSDRFIAFIKSKYEQKDHNTMYLFDNIIDALYQGVLCQLINECFSIKPVDTKTVDAVNIPELVNEFMDGFEDPFTRGEMYKSETGVQSINIAYYFELAMEYALLHKQDVESKSKSLSE